MSTRNADTKNKHKKIETQKYQIFGKMSFAFMH